MTSSIGTTASGGVFIGGTSSGINTTALIEAAVAQKTFSADRLDIQIEENTLKTAAYQQLDDLTNAVDNALSLLRGPESLFDETERVWDQKSGTVLTSDGTDFASLIDIAIGSDAIPGTYDIEVLSIAQSQRVGSNNIVDDTVALGYAGTFDLGLLGGGSANISIGAGDSLQNIRDAINALTDTTGVEASILKVSETEFQLVLSGTETAKDITTFSTSGDDVLALLGVSDGFGGFQNTLQPATGARITFDGIEITRDDNSFDDLIDGIDLTTKNASPGTIISLEVGNDVFSAKEAIEEFVSAYNAFRDFVTQNQQVDSAGNVSEDAQLFGDNILSGIANTYSDFIGQRFNTGGVIETIRDLGISIGNDNKLIISDETALDTALLNNFEDVRDAFASSSESDNNDFQMIGNSSVTNSQAIAFNLTTDGAGTITSVSANGDGSAFTISGNTILGAVGSQYEGLTFAYVGTDTSLTVNVDFNQGLSEKLINAIDGYNSPVDGLLVQERLALQSDSRQKSAEAAEIRERAEAFREAQIERYAKLEADISRLNSLLDQIRAILGNTDDD